MMENEHFDVNDIQHEPSDAQLLTLMKAAMRAEELCDKQSKYQE